MTLKERGLRLTWTRTPDRGDDDWLTSWTADTLIGSVSAMESGDEFEWFVDSTIGHADTVREAQLAAESVYLEALCTSLAAFAEPVDGVNIVPAYDGHLAIQDCRTRIDHTFCFDPEDARRLAISLLAASASTKETP